MINNFEIKFLILKNSEKIYYTSKKLKQKNFLYPKEKIQDPLYKILIQDKISISFKDHVFATHIPNKLKDQIIYISDNPEKKTEAEKTYIIKLNNYNIVFKITQKQTKRLLFNVQTLNLPKMPLIDKSLLYRTALFASMFLAVFLLLLSNQQKDNLNIENIDKKKLHYIINKRSSTTIPEAIKLSLNRTQYEKHIIKYYRKIFEKIYTEHYKSQLKNNKITMSCDHS